MFQCTLIPKGTSGPFVKRTLRAAARWSAGVQQSPATTRASPPRTPPTGPGTHSKTATRKKVRLYHYLSTVIGFSKLGALCCDNGQTKMTCEMMKNLMRCRALGIPKRHCTRSMTRGRNMRLETTIATTTSTTTTTTTTAPTTPSLDYEHLLKQPCSPTKDDLNCCTVRVKSIK